MEQRNRLVARMPEDFENLTLPWEETQSGEEISIPARSFYSETTRQP